jgi:hypothetical protein
MIFSVAEVPDAESTYHAHDFLDATVQPKPIYITPNEIYAMHSLLSQHQEKLVRFVWKMLGDHSHREKPLYFRLQSVVTHFASSYRNLRVSRIWIRAS